MEGSDSPKGFTPRAGCQVPLGTSKENLKAYVENIKKYTRNARIGENVL